MLLNVISVLKSALLILGSQVSMSSNVNVFTVLMTSIFLYISMRSGERRGKLFWSLPFLDCSLYSQVVLRTIFSTDACFQTVGIASAEFLWLAGLAARRETGFLIRLLHQLPVAN